MIRSLWKQLVQLLTNSQSNMETWKQLMSIENSHFQNLMEICDLSLLLKEPTCFQSNNPLTTF